MKPVLFLIANITLRRYFACLCTCSSAEQKAGGAGVPTSPVLLSVQGTKKYLHSGTIPEHWSLLSKHGGGKGRGSTHSSCLHLPRQDLTILLRCPYVPPRDRETDPFPILGSANSSAVGKGNRSPGATDPCALVSFLVGGFFSPGLFSCCTTRWAKATPVRVLPLLQKTGACLIPAGQGTASWGTEDGGKEQAEVSESPKYHPESCCHSSPSRRGVLS